MTAEETIAYMRPSEREVFAIMVRMLETPGDMIAAPKSWQFFAELGLLTPEFLGGVTPLGYEVARRLAQAEA